MSVLVNRMQSYSIFFKYQTFYQRKCKYNIIQGWQFLTLYDDLENNISVFLCVYDDELGLALNMEKKEYDTFIKKYNIEEFYDVMLYGLALIDYNKHYREFFLDIWN